MYFCSICVCACVREWVILVLGFTTSEMFFPLWHDVYMMKTIIGYGQVPMKPLFSHSYTDRTSCIFVPFMRVFLFHLCVCVCEWVREILVLGFTTSEVFSPLTLMSTWWRLSLAMDKLQWSLFFVIVTLIGHHVFLFHLCARVCVSERYYGFGFPH